MKLNSLIKYNSLKIFSILGYVLLISIIYFQFVAFPAAIEIDSIAICHFDANFPLCASNRVEINSITTYFIIIGLGLLSLIAAFFEFLYKKYKLKNKTEIKYSFFFDYSFLDRRIY